MKENGNTLKKSTSKLKSSRKMEIINVSIFKESEIIAKAIQEKMISLVISTIFEKTIESQISSFCLSEMKKNIDNIIDLQFINHDKDDLNKKKIIKNSSQKIILKKDTENDNISLLTEEKAMNKELKGLNKSQFLPEYELIKALNPYSSDYFDNKKIILKILTRKDQNLQNNNDLKYLKNNKKNNNIILEEKDKLYNFWDTVNQPKNAKIDRGASTKIKIDKESFKNKILGDIQENIIEEDKNHQNNNEVKQNTSNNAYSLFKKNVIKIFKKEIGKKEKKPRVQIPTDLPTFDLEPEKIGINEENDSIKILRKEYEINLALKKEREEKEKKLLSQKKSSVINEENSDKKMNMNTNQNANIVKLKPIRIEDLINEFQILKSQTKELKKITDANADSQLQKKHSIKIEVNENPNYHFTEERVEKKRKKRISQINNNTNTNTNTNNNTNIPHNIKKIKHEIDVMEKSGSKYASGSNYNLIKLECGVELTENKRKKSGGKNYFEKYGRLSFELFQNKLNKTTSEYFSSNELKEKTNDSSNKEKTENEKNKKESLKISKSLKNEMLAKKELIRQKSEYDAKFDINNTTNDFMNVKAKNLKIVMNDLDLMKDFELNIETENNFMPQSKYNFFKNKMNKDFKSSKKDLRAINDFNKTVLKNDLWGDPHNSNINENMYNKQPFHFSHKTKKYINYPIIGLPRQRFPPITSIKLKNNNNMIKGGMNFRKVKIKNLSKDNINDN